MVIDSPEPLFGGSAAYRLGSWWFGVSGFAGRHELVVQDISLGAVTGGVATAKVALVLSTLELASMRFELQAVVAAGVTWADGSSTTDVQANDSVRPFIEGRGALVSRFAAWPVWAPFLELYGGRSSGIAARAAGQNALLTGGWIFGGEAGVSF